jgi:hypothetical protein
MINRSYQSPITNKAAYIVTIGIKQTTNLNLRYVNHKDENFSHVKFGLLTLCLVSCVVVEGGGGGAGCVVVEPGGGAN